MEIKDNLSVMETDRLSVAEVHAELSKLKCLKVGFELEYVHDKPTNLFLSTLCDLTGWAEGKKTKKTKDVKVNGEGGSFMMPVKIDQFLEHDLVGYAYIDGSVSLEVVTTPFLVDFDTIKDGIETINRTVKLVADESKGVVYSLPDTRCGHHETFCYDHYAHDFKNIVQVNTIQISRLLMPTMLHLFSCGKERRTRNLEFRAMNQAGHTTTRTEKYTWLHINDDKKMEFRYPDGNMSNVLPAIIACFNRAIIEKAVKFSQYGVLYMTNKLFTEIKDCVNIFTSSSHMDDKYVKIIADNYKFAKGFLADVMSVQELNILDWLCKNPVWVRTFDKKDWRAWEKYDNELLEAIEEDVETELVIELKRVIAMGIIAGEQKTQVDKIIKVMTKNGHNAEEIKSALDTVAYWSDKKNTFKIKEG